VQRVPATPADPPARVGTVPQVRLGSGALQLVEPDGADGPGRRHRPAAHRRPAVDAAARHLVGVPAPVFPANVAQLSLVVDPDVAVARAAPVAQKDPVLSWSHDRKGVDICTQFESFTSSLYLFLRYTHFSESNVQKKA